MFCLLFFVNWHFCYDLEFLTLQNKLLTFILKLKKKYPKSPASCCKCYVFEKTPISAASSFPLLMFLGKAVCFDSLVLLLVDFSPGKLQTQGSCFS